MNIRRIIRRVYLRFHEAVYPDIGEDRPADDSRQFTSRPLVYHPSIRLLFKDGQTHGRFRLTSPLTRRLRAISKFYVRRLLRFTTLYRLVVSV